VSLHSSTFVYILIVYLNCYGLKHLEQKYLLKCQGYLAGYDVQYSLQVLVSVCHENFSFKGYVWPNAISYKRTMDFRIPGSLV